MREVPNSVQFAALEERVLARWQQHRTFERSLQRREGAPPFVFYDGPPFATGLPHYGHILTSFIKDVVPRYHTMRGKHVPRRWGWDCHGLPVEMEVEKQLGLSSPAEITTYGVAAFNDACRQLVMRYAGEWERVMTRLGRWVDFAGAYKTMDADYTESVMWCFKQLHDKGLVYPGTKVVPYCTRCQTALSNFEATLDDSYRERDDVTVTVEFRLVDAAGHDTGESVVAWTTTPWTLPANQALAVHPDLTYVRCGNVWLAEAARERYPTLPEPSARMTGRELTAYRYRGVLTDASAPTRPIFTADWVTATDGTGCVHLAPAHGEVDHATCAAHRMAAVSPVTGDGTYDSSVPAFAGLHVHEATEPLVRALRAEGTLLSRDMVHHKYPHCWRCDRPLVYRAVASWFVKVTAVKDRLLANHERVRWLPDGLGDKRFFDWLGNARDWAVSRNRFWGAPVPVWQCERCPGRAVVGSRAELESLAGHPVPDWHRPAIDEVELDCGACGGTMHRVPDVLDCWFESGAMPYGQAHYPFENAEQFRASFPGDFIVEYVAQTRGWFYTMHVLATALFDDSAFKDVVCHGVILGSDGRKASKRLRNYPDPMELADRHGSDAIRAALLTSGACNGADVKFDEPAVRDAVRRFHLPLWNVLHLYTAYAELDGFTPTGDLRLPDAARLERALLAELEQLRTDLEAAMDRYDFAAAYGALEQFITTLSTWYLRLLKPSLWRAGLDDAKRATYETLHTALAQLAVMAAPFLPFVAELVHEALGGTDSVHLADWPTPRDDRRDDATVRQMHQLRGVLRVARRAREHRGVKHRQPLRSALLAGLPAEVVDAHRELLAAELNVKTVDVLVDPARVVRHELVLDYGKLGKRLRGSMKEVAAAVKAGAFVQHPDGSVEVCGHTLAPDEVSRRAVVLGQANTLAVAADGELVVVLDTTVDAALAREGLARELSRAVQDLRKQARLGYNDPIAVAFVGDLPELDACLAEHEAWLADQTIARVVMRASLAAPLASSELDGVSVAIVRA